MNYKYYNKFRNNKYYPLMDILENETEIKEDLNIQLEDYKRCREMFLKHNDIYNLNIIDKYISDLEYDINKLSIIENNNNLLNNCIETNDKSLNLTKKRKNDINDDINKKPRLLGCKIQE